MERRYTTTLFKSVFLQMLLVCTLVAYASAQETVVSGRVTDASTNEPIPFANIKFRGITTGTSTDFEGYYHLRTSLRVDSIQASYLAYKPRVKKIQYGSSQTVDFQLQPNTVGIKEVVVLAGENPALRIVRNAQKNREKANKNKLDAYQYDYYTKIQVDVDKISNNMRRWKMLKPVTSLFDSLEVAAGEDGDLHMPFFFSENLSEVYFIKKPVKRKKEIIKASKLNAVGIQSGMLTSQFTGGSFEEYNFNENKLFIFNKEFLSPISDNAMLFYEYYLVDSMDVGGFWCYMIKIKPKNKKDLLFTGNMWITDSTWAIKQINVEIPKSVNINFLDRVLVHQELLPTPSGAWIPSKGRLVIDFADISKQFVGLIARFYYSAYNVVENQPKDLEFYQRPIVLQDDAITKSKSYWEANRPERLNATDVYVYDMIDSIKSIPVVKKSVDVFYTLATGYYTNGKIDYGDLLGLVSYNNVEGYKFKMGARTNYLFSDKWILRGYLAYGTLDNRLKYNAQVEQILSRTRWTKAGIQHRQDIDQVGTNFQYDDSRKFGVQQSSLYNTTSQINRFALLNLKTENRMWIVSEYRTGLTGRFTFQNIKYKNYFSNSADTLSSGASSLQKDFTTSELVFEARYAHNEYHVIDDNKRYAIGNSKYPVLTLGYTLGLKDLLGSDYNYSKAYMTVSHRLKMGFLGYSRYSINGGKVFTSVPFTLLEIHRGNQTIFQAMGTFNLMNYFEFISDEYISLDYTHNFEGFIFNRVPLLSRLKFRELLTFRGVYGSLSQANRNPLILNTFSTLSNRPYMEAGFGISNIFRIFRVDFIYRLSYTDQAYQARYKQLQINNGVVVPYEIDRFGVKLSMQFSF